MASVTGGQVDHYAAATIADARSLFGYDNAAVAGGIIEVERVATLPAHGHRGIGDAMTASAVSIEPSWPALLLASDDGRRVYRLLGFVDLLRFTIWDHRPQPHIQKGKLQ